MKIQSRRRILLFQWGGKAYETEDYSCYCRYSDFWMGILACPYSPIPDTVNITEMRVYQLDRGEYADDFTERVDTDTVRELLTHIRARRIPSLRLEGIQEDSFVVEVKYWDKTMCINLGEPGGPDYVYDGILRPTLWMHKVSGGEELLTLLADSYYNKGEG